MKKPSLTTRIALGSLCAFVTLVPLTACAQTISTWTGGGSDSNWGTAGNWSNGVPADSNGTMLVFSGSNRTTSNNNLTSSFDIGRLQFGAGAASFTLTGDMIGLLPYLGSGTQQIIQSSANTQTIATSQISFRSGANSQISLDGGDLHINTNVFIDAPNDGGIVRAFTITGADATRKTVTFAGGVNKYAEGGSAQDPDMYIVANKRVLVTGSLTFGSGNDGSVFVNDGVLQFSGAGWMTGGRPVIGNTSGSGSAAVWLDTAGATFARQLELRNGSSGRRTIGGLNTSGTVTFSGDFAGSSDNYDLAAATGGVAVFSGVRNFNGGLYVNRPDGATAYGGTVILSGTTSSNSFTAIHAGTLQFSDFNQLGSSHFEFNADSGDSGTLRYSGGSATTTKTLWIDNPGITRAAIDVSQAGTTLTWNPGTGTVSQNLTKAGSGWLQFGGGIAGSATVGVEAGMLILTASNSYSGGTVVSGGTLEVSAGGSQGGSPAALGTGTVSIAPGGQVKFWLSQSASNTISNPFSLSGGTLHTTDGYNSYSGLFTLASGSSAISAQYEDTIRLTGGLTGSGNVLFTQAGGTGSWAPPTYVLSGTGANTGTVRVNGSSGGSPTKLQLANVNAIQNATLDLATADTGVVEFTVLGNNTYALGGLQGSRNLAFGANSLSVGGNGQGTTYSGNLSGSGLFTKTGNGTLTLSGNNTNSGGVAVNAGVLALGSANAIGSSGTISFSGGTLQYSASNTSDYSARFSTAAGQHYRIDTNGQSVTFASNLTSTGGSLTKSGAGTLSLTGINIYSGTTTVEQGGFRLDGSIAGDLVVRAIGTLSGTGTIGGNATIAGSHSPGNSPGIQTFDGNLTYQGDESTPLINWELIANTTGSPGTNYDQIVIPTGTLDFASPTTLTLSFAAVGSTVDWSNAFWNVDRSWTVYNLSGGTTTNIGNLALGGSLLDSLGNPLSPTERGYFTTSLSGQDVMLNFVAIPEPSTITLLVIGGVVAGLAARRRATRG